jgi:hypothetical protein
VGYYGPENSGKRCWTGCTANAWPVCTLEWPQKPLGWPLRPVRALPLIGEAIGRSPESLREEALELASALIAIHAGAQSQSEGSPFRDVSARLEPRAHGPGS